MKTRKILHSVCLAALLLSCLEVAVWAGDSKSPIETPKGWPAKLDKRKLYSFEPENKESAKGILLNVLDI